MRGFANSLKEFHQQQSHIVDSFGFQTGIPLLSMAALLLLGWFQVVLLGWISIDFGWIFLVALIPLYTFVDMRIGLASVGALAVLKLLASILSGHSPTVLGLFLFMLCSGCGMAAILLELRKNKVQRDLLGWVFVALLGPMLVTENLMKRLGL